MSSTLLELQTNYYHSKDFKCCSVGFWDFLGSQEVHISEFQVSEKPCHKTRWAVIKEWLCRTSKSSVTLLTVFQTNPVIIPLPQTHFQHFSILPLWGLSPPFSFPLSLHPSVSATNTVDLLARGSGMQFSLSLMSLIPIPQLQPLLCYPLRSLLPPFCIGV